MTKIAFFTYPLLLLFFLLPTRNCFATNVDSLKNVLQSSPLDTTKIEVYAILIDSLIEKNIEEANAYADSILTTFQSVKSNRIKHKIGNSLHKLSNAYANIGNLKEAEKLDTNALNVFKQIKDKRGIALTAQNLTRIYGMQGDLNKAQDFAELARPILEEIKDTFNLANTILNIGNIQFYRNNFNDAVNNYLEALKIFQKLNDKDRITKCYNQIALIMMETGDYDKAEFYYKKNFEIYKEIKNSKGMGNYYNNIGALNHKYYKRDSIKSQLEKALENFQESYKLYVKAENLASQVLALNNIGSMLWKLERYDESISYLEKSLSLGEKIGASKLSTYASLGKLYLKTHNYKKAISYLKAVIEIEKRNNITDDFSLNYKTLSDAYGGLGDYKQAYSTLKISNEYFMKSRDVKIYKQIEETETKYQKAEDEKKIAEQQLTLVQQENTLQKRNYGLLAFGLLSLLLGSIGFNYYKRNRISKKHNQTLTQKNKQISLLNKDIEHRTANHLQTMMLLIESDIENSQDNVIQSALLGQQHRLQVVSSIHAQLQHQGGSKNILFGKYLQELCAYLEDFYLEKYENLQINLHNETKEGYEIDALEATNLGLIINELVTNAVKYAFEKQEQPQINITLKEQNEDLLLTIKDNGSGLANEEIRTGAIGLGLVKDLVKRLHGTYDMQNADGLLCSISFQPKTFAYASN